ncbi:nitroreductase family deazaflavin-dependent oxidoreductase [Gordonia sp. UBA5067]|jgi:deazaflavin-dependent oxidoreductase (nitroreductase family)
MRYDDEYSPSPSAWVRDQVAAYERSGGTEGTTLPGSELPVVIVTMRGAKTGKLRKVPLMRVEHGGEYLAVASKGGSPANPVWYHNLLADPAVQLRDATAVGAYTARQISDPQQRALWWQRAVAAYPPYADYAAKAGRVIPIFLLSPAG